MSAALYRLGRLAARRPWTVIGSWLVMFVLVLGASAAFGQEFKDSMGAPGLDSQKATDLLSAASSEQAGITAQVVVTPQDAEATFAGSPEARDALTQVQSAIRALPNVVTTTDPARAVTAVLEQEPQGLPGDSGLSGDGRVALIRVQYAPLDELQPVDLERLKDIGSQADASSTVQVEMGGDLFFAFEEGGSGGGEVVGLVAAGVILMVAFGSFVAAGLPIGMAVFGLGLGISLLSLVTYLIDVPSWAPVIGSMVGIGVGIDYALFVITRHREYLARGLAVEEAVGRAVSTAGLAVVFAGGTVVIAILGLAVAGVPFMTAGAVAVSLIVVLMVAASITLLPAFLGLCGHWVNRLVVGRHKNPDRPAAAGWYRWGAHVTRHALPYAVGSTVVLLALAAPLLDLRVGTPDDGAMPEHRTERRAYDLVAEGFGAGANGPLVVVVDAADDPAVLPLLRQAVGGDAGIADVGPPSVDPATGIATLVAIPTTGPQDDATLQTIERLRADVFPEVLGESPARAHVGGQTATFADVGGRVNDRLPWFIGVVLLLSWLLLTVVFRSVLVAVKAAVMNVLSIGASFGVMVMVFQWGWGADLIGLESTVPIVPFIPMFMFAILFGLSMDYEVFLLSRIREEYLRSGDNTASVIHGIATTGRVITSAALIMVSVFMGFVLGDDAVTKMFGIGLATAILVDATVVRMLLVPAAMTLMGHANWWLPGWLDRLLPNLDTRAGEDDATAPVSEPEPEPELAPASASAAAR